MLDKPIVANRAGSLMPLLFIVVFSFMAAFALLLPSVMFFLENLGASKALATKILACYSLSQFFAGPLLGRLSDRLGRKITLVTALMLALGAYLSLAALSPSIVSAFIGLAVAGTAAGASAVAFAAVTDLTEPQNRAKGMGIIGASIGLAFTVGPAVGALLSSVDAISATISKPATASVVILVVGLAAALFLPKKLGKPQAYKVNGGPEGNEEEQPALSSGRLAGFKKLIGHSVLMNIALMMFVFTIALALMEPIMPYLIRDRYEWGPREMGYLFGFAGLIVVLVQGGLVGRLAVKFGERKLLATGVSLMGIGLLIMLFAPASWFVVLGLGFTSTGGALFNTSALALASQNAESKERGLVLGAVQSMQSLGRSGGPLVAGNLYQLSAILPLAIGVAAMAILLMCLRFLSRR